MKVFLDDERPTPKGWTRTHTVEETIDLLKTGDVTDLSLDNDLGQGLREGYEVLDWVEEAVVLEDFKPPERMSVHSANAIRAIYMRKLIARIHVLYQSLQKNQF